MKFIIGLLKLTLLSSVLYSPPSFSAAPQCPAVDCDCSSIPSGKWQDLCLVREKSVSEKCVANAGKPASYCGLHGPSGFPVATSIQFKKRPQINLEVSPKSLVPLVETQHWSLLDDFKVLKQKEGVDDPRVAIQIFSLFRKHTKKLYNLQQQVVIGFKAKGDTKESIEYALSFAESTLALATQLSDYSDQVWSKAYNSKYSKNQKAYRSLAFRVARESATIYERSAYLYAQTPNYQTAADVWQNAFKASKKLLAWEVGTSNKAKYVAHYREQSSARLNRATFYWIQANMLDKALENIELVRESLSTEE